MGESSTDTIVTAGTVRSNTGGLALSGLKDDASGGAANLSAAASRAYLDDVDTALKYTKWMESRLRVNSKSIRVSC